MNSNRKHFTQYIDNIKKSGLTIYDSIKVNDPDLWIPTLDLEELLDNKIKGISLAGLPLRTRSKIVKKEICQALGYPIPPSFKKVQPRFLGQLFDTYVQKSNNLQIWNEDLSLNRRYVLIRVNEYDEIIKVKVVTGDVLVKLDTTGTLTQKYQAKLILNENSMELISDSDTDLLSCFVNNEVNLATGVLPTFDPQEQRILPIKNIFERLKPLIGKKFANIGYDQERNRGAILHRLVCEHLGYYNYCDNGQFPDIRHQLLEVKLQTSHTIDLGLVCPNSKELLNVPIIKEKEIRHCDVRYALFYADINQQEIALKNLYVITGEMFFTRFPQFQGKTINKKLQIPLPSNFFTAESE